MSGELEKIREEIDQIDAEILNLIYRRMSLMPKVAEIKGKEKLPVTQVDRMQKIFERNKKFAEEKGLNAEMLNNIYKEMIDEAIRIEDRILKNNSHE